MALIDKDVLIETVENSIHRYWNSGDGGYYLAEDAIEDIKNAPIIDPIHAAGGCYCWECEKNEKGHCLIMRGCSVIQMGFCGYGRRKENHENTHTTQDP